MGHTTATVDVSVTLDGIKPAVVHHVTFVRQVIIKLVHQVGRSPVSRTLCAMIRMPQTIFRPIPSVSIRLRVKMEELEIA